MRSIEVAMRRGLTVLMTAALLSLAATAGEASDKEAEGFWYGPLKAGAIELRLGFVISRGADGTLRGVMDSLDEGVTDIPMDEVKVAEKAVAFTIKPLTIAYQGRLSADGQSIKGLFTQQGARSPSHSNAPTRGWRPPGRTPQEAISLCRGGGELQKRPAHACRHVHQADGRRPLSCGPADHRLRPARPRTRRSWGISCSWCWPTISRAKASRCCASTTAVSAADRRAEVTPGSRSRRTMCWPASPTSRAARMSEPTASA